MFRSRAMPAALLAVTLLASPMVTAPAAAAESAESGTRAVLLKAKDRKAVAGRKARLKGRVRPAQSDVKVSVQRWTGTKWVPAAKKRTNRKGRFTVRVVTPKRAKRTWFRAKAVRQRGIVSGNVEVRLTRPKKKPAGPAGAETPTATPSTGQQPPAPQPDSPTGSQPVPPQTVPQDVAPLDPQTVAAAGAATCALDVTGKAWCWGAWGESASPRPTPVPGDRQYTTIAMSADTACALDRYGKAWCWGDPTATGSGNPAGDRETPVAVAGDHTFSAITGGAGDRAGMCALDTTGAAWCWGWGLEKSIGGANTVWSRPRSAAGQMMGLTGIALGDFHGCVLDSAHRAWCWGENSEGQLGSGNPTLGALSPSPVKVAGGISFRRIVASTGHTCALADSDGQAWCWGMNEDGQLGSPMIRNIGCAGLGSINDWFCQPAPTAVDGGMRNGSIALGSKHSCGVNTAGQTRCWGDNTYAQLGTGSLGVPTATPQLVSAGWTVAAIASGSLHTCALGADSRIRCWGAGASGQLGMGAWTDYAETPALVTGGNLFKQP